MLPDVIGAFGSALHSSKCLRSDGFEIIGLNFANIAVASRTVNIGRAGCEDSLGESSSSDGYSFIQGGNGQQRKPCGERPRHRDRHYGEAIA